MALGARVKKRRTELRMTQVALAEKVGVSQGIIATLENRDSQKSNYANKIAEVLGVRMEWLTGGEEPMLAPVKVYAYDIEAYDDISDVDSSDHTHLPLLEIELSAGSGAAAPEFVETRYKLPFRLDWVISEGVKPESVKIMKVKGDSMQTTLGDGDKVLLNTDEKTVIDGKVYAVVMNNDLYVKRLFKTYNGGLDIVSDNSDFDKITVPPNETHYIHIIGRVFHKMGNSGL